MKPRRRHILTFSAILLVALYLGFRFYESQLGASSLKHETLERAVPTVAIIHPKLMDPEDTIVLPGNIQAWFEAPIYAQVSGYVKMWYKDYGAQVKKGEVLAEISQPTLDAEYRQALADFESERAKLDLAEITAKRYLAMRKKQAVSEQAISVKVQEAKAQKAVLNASAQKVRNLEARLRFKTIVAPYDGIVTARNINVGDYVNAEGNLSGTAQGNLFTVADISMMRLFVSVPESFGAFLRSGMTAYVTVPQFPNRRYDAKFLTVAKGFDVTTRTVITEFTIENEDRSLWPGSYATVHLTAPVEQNFYTIPSTTLVFQEKGTEVAVLIEGDRVRFKPITVRRILDNAIEVQEGISENDRIINNPSAALLEGDTVRVVTPTPGFDLVTANESGSKSSLHND
ncbi:MAG: efflux RND transporter periplasmic adaptor subunit [Nitrospirales bacterium]